jgi:thiamine phosphate synthase YjbQ (UPF0047 family)
MDTPTAAHACRPDRVRLSTRHPTEFIDLTACLERLAVDAGVDSGTLVVQAPEAARIVVLDEPERRLLDGFRALLECLAPDAGDRPRRAGVPGAAYGPAAGCRTPRVSGRGPQPASSLRLSIARGRLALARSRRVFLVELDGPRDRDLVVRISGEAAP